MQFIFICILSSVFLVCSRYIRTKRPFYIIGHMANSISEAARFLKKGANALEIDIQFNSNGSIAQVYHGRPCDCFRICTHKAQLPEYLKYVRQITDPVIGNYSNQMVFQFFDLKLNNVDIDRLYYAGEDIATHILDYLWWDNTQNNVLKVLLFVRSARDRNVISGLKDTFQSRKKNDLLVNVGFDGGLGSLSSIQKMFEEFGIQNNIWIGDGTLNCFSSTYPDNRLKHAISIRDSNDSFIDKVYHWTIDETQRMHVSLHLEIDGIITNVPHKLKNLLNKDPYPSIYRLATTDDNPFTRFHPVEYYATSGS